MRCLVSAPLNLSRISNSNNTKNHNDSFSNSDLLSHNSNRASTSRISLIVRLTIREMDFSKEEDDFRFNSNTIRRPMDCEWVRI